MAEELGYLCWNIPLSLRVHPSEGFQQLPGNALFLAVTVHDLQEVCEADLAPLVPHVGLQLCDGGGHAQASHDHRQLIHCRDLTRSGVQGGWRSLYLKSLPNVSPCIQIEALTELINVGLFEVSCLRIGK